MSTHETSFQLSSSYDCPQRDGERLIQRVEARLAQIGGGIPVNRLLPSRQRRMIGAWCFLDHAGPARFEPGEGMRVGPHPHTGLQTFTWMIEGEVLHRDSLGSEQVIRPGEINLMTAGRGISHSEVCLDDQRVLHAAQLWIALPAADSDCAPAFEHHSRLPRWEREGCAFTLLAGSFEGHTARARLYTPLLGVELHSPDRSRLELVLERGFEYGILPLEGVVRIGGETFAADQLAYLGRGRGYLSLELAPGSRALLLGGEPFAEEILIWWNFVGHSKTQIARAQRDWEAGSPRFGGVPTWDGTPLVAPPLPWRMKE